jgi:hypothetical protein
MRITKTLSSTAVLFSAMLMATACGGEKKTETQPGSAKTAPVAKDGKNVPTKSTGAAASWKLFPSDSLGVVSINLETFRKGAAFAMAKPFIEKAMKENAEELQKCGFNPVETIKTATIAFNATSGGKDGKGVVHITGVTQAQLEKCLADEGLTKNGTIWTVEENTLAWLGADSFLMANGYSVDELKGFAAGKGGLSASLSGLVSKVNKNSTVWIVGDGKAFADAGAPVEVNGFLLALDFKKGISVDLSADLGDAGKVTEMMGQAKAMLPMVSAQLPFLKNIKLGNDGSWMTAKLNLSMADAKGLMGMMGGL